ncbi:MAG: PorV/PorQ family protein [Ignavibacteriaceae bacterium]|nr:PorV/PorQ family protein [Ignavibacteriaceae bacterium]
MKMKFITVYLILIASFTFAQGGGIDKVGTTSFQFLKVMPGARSTGMGEAFVSVVNNSDAVFWNPGALVEVNKFDVSIYYVDWFLDVSQLALATAYTIESFGTLALQLQMNNVGDIPITRVDYLYRDPVTGIYNPGLTGETMSPGFFVGGISYAKSLTDKFSFGLSFKVAYEDLYAESASSWMFDGGLIYKTGFRSIVVAVALRNFGQEVKFVNREYPLPQVLTFGISANLFAPDNSLIADIDNQTLLLAYNLSQPRDYSQQHNVGAEYSFYDMFFLRAGYKINYDEEGLTLGAGVGYQGYRVDYSFNDFGEYLGNVHRFTIGFSITN